MNQKSDFNVEAFRRQFNLHVTRDEDFVPTVFSEGISDGLDHLQSLGFKGKKVDAIMCAAVKQFTAMLHAANSRLNGMFTLQEARSLVEAFKRFDPVPKFDKVNLVFNYLLHMAAGPAHSQRDALHVAEKLKSLSNVEAYALGTTLYEVVAFGRSFNYAFKSDAASA